MRTEEKLSPDSSETRQYYKIQIKAWTGFDPSDMDLKQIAENVERGQGALTAIEVVKVADNLEGIDDIDVRDRFETIEAVEKVMQSVDAIPKPLLERLLDQLISGTTTTKKNEAA